MLALTRKKDEKIMIKDGNDLITITVIGMDRGKVRLGFEAGPGVKIYREEIYNRIQGGTHAKGDEAEQQAEDSNFGIGN